MKDIDKGIAIGMLMRKGGGNLTTKEITENGTYTAKDEPVPQGQKKYDGYSEVTVNVSGGEVDVKTITENGTYVAEDDDLYGYSQVDVDVPTYEDEIEAIKDVIEEETGERPEDPEDVIDAIEEAYATHQITPLSVTANGTYTASGNVDGYSPVTVNVPTYEDEYREMLESELVILVMIMQPAVPVCEMASMHKPLKNC